MSENLKQSRGQIKGKLTRFQNFLDSIGKDELNEVLITEINMRIDKVEPCLNEFEKIQSELEKLDSKERDDPTEMLNFEVTYFKLLSEAKQLCISFEKNNVVESGNSSGSGSINGSLRSVANSVAFNNAVKLPAITLPVFDGQYKNWLEFKDGFKELVDNNPTLNDAQRFHYLRSSLTKEAATVIKSLEVTARNYASAWTILEQRFENKALMIHNHMKSMFEYPNLQRESFRDLRRLYDSFKEDLHALETLGEDTKAWDRFVIYLLSTKFDEDTKRDWESYEYESDLPTMADMHKFLSNKCTVLEKIDVKLGKSIQNKPRKNKDSTNSFVVSNKGLNCYFCNQLHAIYNCNKFLQLSIDERTSELKKRKLCLNCLKPNHVSWNCNAKKCIKCNKPHNSLIHIENVSSNIASQNSARVYEESEANASSSDTKNEVKTPARVRSAARSADSEVAAVEKTSLHSSGFLCEEFDHTKNMCSQILLATALVNISINGNIIIGRAFLDTGSQSNFVTENFTNKLNAQIYKTNHVVNGIGQTHLRLHNEIRITLSSRNSDFKITTECLVIPKITNNLPQLSFNKNVVKIPGSFTLADPNFNISSEIDLLLGSNIFWSVLRDGQHLLGENMPVLQNTAFGWVLAGQIIAKKLHKPIINTKFEETSNLLCVNDAIDDQISKFWSLEEVITKNRILSDAEKFCELHFESSTKRDSTGRFIVNIPFKESVKHLGNSKDCALKMFYAMENKFLKNSSLQTEYTAFMEEYKNLGHMTEIIEDKIKERNEGYFMPHHAVLKSSSVTTKCRVVFNASMKTDTGLSLNDAQYVGPALQNDIFDILVRFRQYQYVITADISKMYRQIFIDEEQRCYQKLFWRSSPRENIKCYKLNTLTYGTASAPYLAVRCMMQLAAENRDKFPRASEIIANSFYIDDLLTGADSLKELLQIQKEISSILMSAGFELRKWLCNEPQILNEFLVNEHLHASILQIGENENNKTLGIWWNAASDIIQYSVNNFDNDIKTISKRKILSIICQIYDPLGLLGPIIVKAKLLLQELWKLRISWDDDVPPYIFDKWLDYQRNLESIRELQIPRHAVLSDYVIIELHGFADSSEKAYGACLYLRCENSYGLISCNLLCAKSRVTPVKSICLPRLELCAAVLLANLSKRVLNSLTTNFHKKYYWTDSAITLAWLQGDISKWKTFVANRVSEINSLTEKSDWYHVRSRDNPADMLSRGVDTKSLICENTWWTGPNFLLRQKNDWNISKLNLDFEVPETRAVHTVLVTIESLDIFSGLINKYSALNKLLRITSYILRFIKNCSQSCENKLKGSITPGEMETSLLLLVKTAQIECFQDDYNSLLQNKPLNKKSKILALNPFCHNNVIRVGGRVKNTIASFDEKHQIILPKSHKLTELIIQNEHKKLLHCGVQSLMNSIRQKFWIISARNACKKVIHKCISCFRNKPQPISYLMGDLPEFRVKPYAPFVNIGIDYGGPFNLKDRKTRGAKIIKGYLCLIVCMSTKAVHLELVTELTTACFLAALKRFMSRRGRPSNIYSDNSLTFVGANNEIKRFYEFLSSETDLIASKLAEERVSWHFIPARSPSFGGIWEAGIKSCKYHLKRVLGDRSLTYEDFSTLLIEIEGILNSRPLCPLHNDPDDLSALTPAHFIIGRPLTMLPEVNILNVPENKLPKFQRVQAMLQHFWERWQKEYVTELQTRVKWRQRSNCLIKIGSLVLVKKDNVPPFQWPLGRITAVFPGDDGIIRVVEVQIQGDLFKRAITKVCLLPVDEPSGEV